MDDLRAEWLEKLRNLRYFSTQDLDNAPPEILGDEEFMTEAVKKNGRVLTCASPELQKKSNLVKLAIIETLNPNMLDYLDLSDDVKNELQNNEDIKGLIQPPVAINEISRYQYVEAANRNWSNLLTGSPEQVSVKLSDKLAVIAAINSGWGGWEVIEHVSPEMQNDRDVALYATENNVRALRYVSPALLKNDEFMREAIKRNPSALCFASPELQNDKEIVLEAVRKYGDALEYASPELQGDKEIVLAAISESGVALEFASPEMQNDRDVVLAAVKQNGNALKYASPELQGDIEIVKAAVAENRSAIKYASFDVQNALKEETKASTDSRTCSKIVQDMLSKAGWQPKATPQKDAPQTNKDNR